MTNDRTSSLGDSPTTRRTFLTALGFSVVSLGGLWGLYGALAPEDHGGQATSPEEFRQQVEGFAERYRQPDGSVKPRTTKGGEEHIEVYLMAFQWGYMPRVLRLQQGVPYLFKMSCLDVLHGASIQLGRGSLMVRLRPGVVSEKELTFNRPGEYLVYCTTYCGYGHDVMWGKILVEA